MQKRSSAFFLLHVRSNSVQKIHFPQNVKLKHFLRNPCIIFCAMFQCINWSNHSTIFTEKNWFEKYSIVPMAWEKVFKVKKFNIFIKHQISRKLWDFHINDFFTSDRAHSDLHAVFVWRGLFGTPCIDNLWTFKISYWNNKLY